MAGEADVFVQDEITFTWKNLRPSIYSPRSPHLQKDNGDQWFDYAAGLKRKVLPGELFNHPYL